MKSREPYFVRHIPVRGSAKTLFETKVEITKKAGTPHATIWKWVERTLNELKILDY